MDKDVTLANTKDPTLPSVNLVQQNNSSNDNQRYQNSDNSRFHNNQSYDATRGRGRHFKGGGRSWYPKNRVQCQICHKFGHTADKCYFRVPYQTNYGRRHYNQPSPGYNNQPMSAMLMAPYLNKDTNWYLDSGATNHITHDMNNLAISNEIMGGQQIHTANGAGLSVTHSGY